MITAVCAIARLENHYIREWVNYYISIGFDKIILYDNNEIDGENLIDPIKDYVDSGQLDLINARGKKGYQVEAYNDCFQKYKDEVDWILFVDIDEFIAFDEEKPFNIKEFINSNDKFKNCDIIKFIWSHYTDNDLITVQDNNYSVLKRFTKKTGRIVANSEYKQIININKKTKQLNINGVHSVLKKPVPAETSALIVNDEELINSLVILHSDGTTFTGWRGPCFN